MILMKYHTLFLSKTRKDVAKLSSAAVVSGALMIKSIIHFFHLITHFLRSSACMLAYSRVIVTLVTVHGRV